MEAPQVIQCHTSGRLIDTINLEFSRTRCDLAELRSVNEASLARSPLRERIFATWLLRLEFWDGKPLQKMLASNWNASIVYETETMNFRPSSFDDAANSLKPENIVDHSTESSLWRNSLQWKNFSYLSFEVLKSENACLKVKGMKRKIEVRLLSKICLFIHQSIASGHRRTHSSGYFLFLVQSLSHFFMCLLPGVANGWHVTPQGLTGTQHPLHGYSGVQIA